MKNTKRVLFIFLVSMLMAAVSMFAMACSETETPPTPPPASQQYTITFMVGTAPYETITGEAGSAVNPPADPARANFHFDGWSESENGAVVVLPQTMPSENKTYYAVFSARYALTLDAGIGTLGEGSGSLSVKAGDNLYELVKDITPTAPGDSTFGGWFYGGNKLTAQSTVVMPSGAVTVSAKYEVGYTVDIYKQTEYGVDEYDDPELRDGTGYVGELISGISFPTGYNIDAAKSTNTTPLSSNRAQNAFVVYFNFVDYQVIFNPNLPSEADVQGSMDNATWGHSKEYDVPESGFTADGYRFIGWSTSLDTSAEIYAPGDKISVTSVTNLYCRWVKGLTDSADESSDIVYIFEDYALLERIGYDDYRGTYNATTDEFVFLNSGNEVIVRGIAYKTNGTYVYLLDSADDSYVLRYVSDGTDGATAIDNDVRLKLNVDGSAVYNNGSAGAVTGTYEFDADEKSLKFVSSGKEFYFRTATDNGTPVFEIRGAEYGVYFKADSMDRLDTTFYMAMDGYGAITVYSVGLDSSLQKNVTTTVNGYYWYNQKTETVTEYAAFLLNSQSNYRVIVFRLFNDKNYGTAETPITHVYKEKTFGTTLYERPSADDFVDKENDANIVLDGYGVYADSAVYTYYDDKGAAVIVKGSYKYDSAMRMIEITPKTPASATALKFALYAVESEEEGSYDFLFEPAERNYGEYIVNDLSDVQLRKTVYPLRIYNNGVAAFAFLSPMQDQFYGSIKMELVSDVIVGTLTYDERLAEYTFAAEVDPEIAQILYQQYYQLAQMQFDVSGFGSFKFTISYSDSACNVTARGDYTVGATVVYDGVTYTTDGFGKAKGTDGSVKDYIVSDAFGIPAISLNWGTGNDSHSQLYFYINDGYVAYQSEYRIINTTGTIKLVLLENNMALLINVVSSGYSSTFTVYSIGTVVWEEGTENRYGVYRETEAVNSSVAVTIKDFNEFRFGFTSVQSSNGNAVEVIFAYDSPASATENKYTLTSADGTLVIDRENATAKYTDPANVTIEGSFTYYDNIITVSYTVGEGDDAQTEAVRLQLVYDGQNVTSFKKVGIEAGKWVYNADGKGYIVLDGAGNAQLYEYNSETSQLNAPVSGWYVSTENESRPNEYAFHEGEKPATVPTDAQPEFKFIIGVTSSGVRLFQKYIDNELAPEGYALPVYANMNGSMTRIGTLSGGGYSNQKFNYMGMYDFTGMFLYVGSSPFNAVEQGENAVEMDIYAFVTTSGNIFYIGEVTIPDNENKMYIMLDGTVNAATLGRYVYATTEGCTVKVPVLEGEETVTREIVVKGILLSGLGDAALITEGADGNEEYYACVYLSGSNNTYMLAAVIGEDVKFISTFRLYVRTVEENREYYTLFIDSEFIDDETRYIVFKNDSDMSCIRFDGYGSALYIDGKGVAHNAMYERLEAHPEVIRIRYLSGTLSLTEMYVTVTTIENDDGTYTYKYTVLDPSDDRIPSDDASEPEPAEPTNEALAA